MIGLKPVKNTKQGKRKFYTPAEATMPSQFFGDWAKGQF